MSSEFPAEPWYSFISELDAELSEPTEFHCIGGFVVSEIYGFKRETPDLDFLCAIPSKAGSQLIQIAGRGSALHKKHQVASGLSNPMTLH